MNPTPTDEDLFHIYGPRNANWVKRFVLQTLQEVGIPVITDEVRSVIENVLRRVWPLAPGTNLGILIAFELSQRTSQKALDSAHILDSASDTTWSSPEGISTLTKTFRQCLSFSGLLSQRKGKDHVFICMRLPSPSPPATASPFLLRPSSACSSTSREATATSAAWPVVDTDIYAVPLKEANAAICIAHSVGFVTQPFLFPNEFIGFVNALHLYRYMAQQEDLMHVLPLLHILALVSCKRNPPVPFNRHGLKQRKVDFLRRASFEDVLSAVNQGALDGDSVTSESITSALLTATKSAVGSTYMDLLVPSPSP